MNPLLDDVKAHRPMCRRGEGFADQLEVDDAGVIRGRAVPYGKTIELMPGLHERFLPGAFGRQHTDPARVKVCLEHGQVVGRVTELREKDDGLWFVGAISGSDDIPEARKARAMLAEDLADELSVGFMTVPGGTDIEEDDDGTVTYRHRRARLMEVSLVPWGAYGRDAVLSRSLLLDPASEARAARIAEARAWAVAFRQGQLVR